MRFVWDRYFREGALNFEFSVVSMKLKYSGTILMIVVFAQSF